MADREERLAIVVYAQDLASRTLRSVNKELGGMGGIARTASKGLANAYGNLKMLALGGAALAIGGGAAAVKWAADFGAELNTINTIAQVPPAQLQKIGDGIRGLAKTTGASLDDLTSGYYDLLSAGVKVGDAQAVLEQSYRLGRGALGTTSEAVDVLTTALNAYNLKGKDAAGVSDMLAKAVADGKIKLTDIAGSFADVASVAANAGIGINQIAAGYGLLTAKGVVASEVTTQMSRAIIELMKPNADLVKLQKKTKENFADTAREKGLVVALQDMRDAADKAGVPFINLFGRVEGYKYALATTGPNNKAFNAELARIGDSAGTLSDQVGARNQGLAYDVGVLRQKLIDAGITIGNDLMPELDDLTNTLSDFIDSHQGDIETFGKNLAGAFKGAVDWAEKLDWKAIADDLRAAGGFAKGLIDAFLGAPAWLQQAVVTGWGLNKLTGGAVGDIIGSVATGLIKGVLGINAGVVNVKGAVVNSGGLGGVGAAGGGGLGVAITKAIPLVLAAATIYELGQALGDQSKANAQGEADLNAQGNDFRSRATLDQLRTALIGLRDQDKSLNNGLSPEQIAYQMNIDGVRTALTNQIVALEAEIASRTGANGSGSPDDRDRSRLFDTLDRTADHADALAGSLGELNAAAGSMAKAAEKEANAILAHIGGIAGVTARAKAKGLKPTDEQIRRTWEKDLLHQAQITADSNKTNAEKLAQLRAYAASADAHGDRTVAAKIAALSATLDGDLKNLPSQIKFMLPGDTYSEGAHPLPKPGTPTPTPTGGGQNHGNDKNNHGNAAGGLGHAWSQTDLGYYGEAGHEAVAILRNPKKMLSGDGMRAIAAHLAITLNVTAKLDTLQAASQLYRANATIFGTSGSD